MVMKWLAWNEEPGAREFVDYFARDLRYTADESIESATWHEAEYVAGDNITTLYRRSVQGSVPIPIGVWDVISRDVCHQN